MTSLLSQPDELHELLTALTDGEMSGEQFGRLQQLLLQNPAAQAYYRQYMRLCACWSSSGRQRGRMMNVE